MAEPDFQIREADINSVKELLHKLFRALPKEVIEDAVGDTLLYMLSSERGYKITSGNLFALSRFKLYKEKTKVSKVCSFGDGFSSDYEEELSDFRYDKYSVIKDGTLDDIISEVENSNAVTDRDMRIFKRCNISGVPVKEIADDEGLALSPTYRIIKKVKKKFREASKKHSYAYNS